MKYQLYCHHCDRDIDTEDHDRQLAQEIWDELQDINIYQHHFTNTPTLHMEVFKESLQEFKSKWGINDER